MSDPARPVSVSDIVELIERVQALLARDRRAAEQAQPRDEDLVAALTRNWQTAVADAAVAAAGDPGQLAQLHASYMARLAELTR